MGNNNALTVVEGSLLSVVNASNTTLADAFMGVDAIAIVDVSGSMDAHDSRGSRSRYEVACEELANLQKRMPGRFLVVSFSSEVSPNIGGVPVFQGGGTDMVKALKYVKQFDVAGMRFFLISDGSPDRPEETLEVAKTFTGAIECVYVGPEGDLEGGRRFLQRLSESVGSHFATADRVMELATAVETLMLGSGG